MTTNVQAKSRVAVDVWSDVMCPFCYMGDALLGQAVQQSGHDVEIRYRSFQLMPELPTDRAVDLNELLAQRRGFPRAQAEAMNAQMAQRGALIGLDYRMDRVIAINTRSAHRLSHFAKADGRQHPMMERLFRAYFTDGLNIGDHEVLAGLAAEIGLDGDRARAALDSGAYSDDVDDDIDQARQLGITGVPFFVFDGKWAISGAQPLDTFVQALDTALRDKGAAPG